MVQGNRDLRYTYGKNNELLTVTDTNHRLAVTYQYDVMGRETKRSYGNGVTQETKYDRAGRTVLVLEKDAGREVIRGEAYVYDSVGRRSHSIDEQGRVTKYEYDGQSRLSRVLYPWSEAKAAKDKAEAEEAGLYFGVDAGRGSRYSPGAAEMTAIRAAANRLGPNRGSQVTATQTVWPESYEYDGNGNRISKTTPWGTIRYTYDGENRLQKRGDIVYRYDMDGNLLSEKGLRREAEYQYNGANRMIYAEVINHGERSRVQSRYAYDGFGRRTVVQDAGGAAVRTLYDGMSFEIIREGVTFTDGSFTTKFSSGIQSTATRGTEGSRYRWIGDEADEGQVRTRNLDEGAYSSPSRNAGTGVPLYARGEAVAISRGASTGSRGGAVYLGKDLLGSVRSATGEYGTLEARYEYDAFGTPYEGTFEEGMTLGYTGKPYDPVTGLYNYGYRDYQPVTARFTTVDPVRDGANWFAYVNNDPVNWVDLWGLACEKSSDKEAKPTIILNQQEKQNLAAGIPITPIQEGIYTVTDG
jgi:RHS repeat-associated protein